MTEGDKPLAYHWRALDETWIDALDLPKAKTRKHAEARAAIVLDAGLAGIAEPERFISYSRRHDWWSQGKRYRGAAFTATTVPKVIDELASLGLVENEVAPVGRRGWQSRFRATSELVEVARAALVLPSSAMPAVVYEPGEVIRLTDADGKLIDYRDTRRTEGMRRELMEINEALRATKIGISGEGISSQGQFLRLGDAVVNRAVDVLHRVFGRRSFSLHGRLYGPWWQNLPKAFRKCLSVNGEAVAELDYAGQHLRMLYAEKEAEIGEADAYEIGEWPRDTVKKAVVALINAQSEKSAIGAICDGRNCRPALTGPGARTRANQLIEAIKRRHAPIADTFHQDQGVRLMNKDSELVLAVLKGMLQRGVLVLPIHDSFISDIKSVEHLREEMETAWHCLVGKERCSISMLYPESFPHMPAGGVAVALPVGRQVDLFGGRPVPRGLSSWSGGLATPNIRRYLRDEIRDRNIRGVELAEKLGISRPQLVNVLQGRFGTTPRVAEAIKNWALEGETL